MGGSLRMPKREMPGWEDKAESCSKPGQERAKGWD